MAACRRQDGRRRPLPPVGGGRLPGFLRGRGPGADFGRGRGLDPYERVDGRLGADRAAGEAADAPLREVCMCVYIPITTQAATTVF